MKCQNTLSNKAGHHTDECELSESAGHCAPWQRLVQLIQTELLGWPIHKQTVEVGEGQLNQELGYGFSPIVRARGVPAVSVFVQKDFDFGGKCQNGGHKSGKHEE